MRVLCVCLMIILWLPAARGQQGRLDSLKLRLSERLADTLRVRLLLDAGAIALHSDLALGEAYISEALTLSQQAGAREHECHALNLLGLVWRRKNDYPKALEYMLQSLKIAEELGKPRRVATALNNMGIVQWNMRSYSEAMSLFQRAAAIQISLGNREPAANAWANIGMINHAQERYDSAMYYYRKSLAYYTEVQHPVGMPTSYHNIAVSLREQGNIDSALWYFQKALLLYRADKNVLGEVNTLKNTGKAYIAAGQQGAAGPLLEEALSLAHENQLLKEEMESYESLSQYYAQTGNPKKALDLLRTHIALRDSVYDLDKARQIEELRRQYEADKRIALLQKNAEMERNRRYALTGGLLALTLIVMLLIYAYVLRLRQNRSEKALFEKEKIHLQTIEEAQRLRAEKLENELDYRNRELAAKTMHIIQKNDVLNRVSNQIREFYTQSKDSAPRQQLSSLSREIAQGINIDKDWEEFKMHFEGVHSGFFERLRGQFPSLTTQDLRFCAYFRMNLSSKEIAVLLNLSPRGVETHRYRLRKKLGIQTHEDIYLWMAAV